VAESGRDGARAVILPGLRYATGWCYDAPNAKANFQFERLIRAWRDRPVLDLRLKK